MSNRPNEGGGYVLLRTVCTPQCLSLDYAMQRATGLRRLRVVERHEKPRPVQPEVVRVSRRLDGKGSRSRTVAASTPRATAARRCPGHPDAQGPRGADAPALRLVGREPGPVAHKGKLFATPASGSRSS